MRAMLLEQVGQPLQLRELQEPQPGPGELRVKVLACGVCRTDLHVVDGELPAAPLPIIPGHEIVGRVDALGAGVTGFELGQRVGIPWLGHTCGSCSYCQHAEENLCDAPQFTCYTRPGGYAEKVVADARFAFALGEQGDDVALAPLLCAGLIGWRSLVKAGDGKRLGLYGFGAAAQIVMQVARWQGRDVYAFSRPGDVAAQDFARSLGAVWAGDSTEQPPVPLDAAIIYAPAGELVPAALRRAQGRPGGLRGHPHERHPELSLRHPLAGARSRLGGQPDPPGRPGFLPHRRASQHPHRNPRLPAGAGQPGTGRSAQRALSGRGGAGALIRLSADWLL